MLVGTIKNARRNIESEQLLSLRVPQRPFAERTGGAEGRDVSHDMRLTVAA